MQNLYAASIWRAVKKKSNLKENSNPQSNPQQMMNFTT